MEEETTQARQAALAIMALRAIDAFDKGGRPARRTRWRSLRRCEKPANALYHWQLFVAEVVAENGTMDRLPMNAPMNAPSNVPMNGTRTRSTAKAAQTRRDEVERLYKAGHRQTEIADILGITQARVSQIMTDIERRRTNKRRMLRMHPPEHATA